MQPTVEQRLSTVRPARHGYLCQCRVQSGQARVPRAGLQAAREPGQTNRHAHQRRVDTEGCGSEDARAQNGIYWVDSRYQHTAQRVLELHSRRAAAHWAGHGGGIWNHPAHHRVRQHQPAPHRRRPHRAKHRHGCARRHQCRLNFVCSHSPPRRDPSVEHHRGRLHHFRRAETSAHEVQRRRRYHR